MQRTVLALVLAACSGFGFATGAWAACEPYTMTARDKAALDVATLADGDLAPLRMQRHVIGKWDTDGGQFYVFDPLWDDYGWLKPADRTVPAGSHAVERYETDIEGWGKRNMLIVARLGAAKPTQWQRTCFGADQPDSWATIGIDAGTVGIADADTVKNYEAFIAEQIDAGKIQGATDLHQKSFESLGYTTAGFLFQPDADRPGNLVLASIGAGDGSYPVYWGLDEKDAPQLLVISSGLLEQNLANQGK